MRLQLSRTLSIAMGQFVLNIFLASWLYDEYLHNPFMQQYVSGFWTSNAALISITIVAAAVICGGTYFLVWRGQGLGAGVSNHPPQDSLLSNGGQAAGLTALDVCPVCNGPLKALSEIRFQCRKCRRYFKK